MKHKLLIGITGSFGTGKTTVAKMFEKLGAYVIDADCLGWKFMRPRGTAYKKVISQFGKNILKRDCTINKRKLASLVFNNKKKLRVLENLIHPLVIKEAKKLAKETRKKVVIIDAPLLVEAGLVDFVDKLIVVKTGRGAQTERCLRRGFSKDDIRRRVSCQLALTKKLKMADFIIDNNGSISLTRKQVKRIWEEIKNGNY